MQLRPDRFRYSGRKHIGQPIENQVAFRGRKDDGIEGLQESDGGATWEAGLNVDYNWEIGTRTRLRFLWDRVNSASAQQNQLWSNYNGTGYQLVHPDTNPHVTLDATQFYDPATDCTEFTGRLGSGSFNADHNNTRKGSTVNEAQTGPVVFDANNEMEFEFCMRLKHEAVVAGNTILFRLRREAGNVLTNYLNTPELTIIAPTQRMFLN